MLHVRVVSPSDVTAELVAVLVADAGVLNLTVLPASVRNPDGDAVLFDVVQGRANEVIGRLRQLQLDRRGSIALEPVATSISAADQAGAGRSRFDDFAPVWEEVDARIRADGRFPPSWYGLLVIAGLIAAVGLLTNSQILIVGAMVVGPDFGPLAAMAVGLARRRWRVVRQSALALAAGYGLGILVTIPFARLMTLLRVFPPDPFALAHPNTAFIWQPNAQSYVVGLLAGIAGVLSLTSAKSGALIGVLISVTTVPAAGAAALAMAYGDWLTARTSLIQLLINLIAIVTGGTVTLLVQIAIARRRDLRRVARRGASV